jgi:hypothetical protein
MSFPVAGKRRLLSPGRSRQDSLIRDGVPGEAVSIKDHFDYLPCLAGEKVA